MRAFPVRTLTRKGKWMVILLKGIFELVHLFKKKSWRFPLINFEENPLTMGETLAIYLGYKYYLKPHVEATENWGLETHFRSQKIDFTDNGFTEETSCTLHAGGDLMPYQLVNKHSAADLWNETGDWFFNADMVFANLETPLKLSKKAQLVPEVMLNDMYFNCSEEMFSIFNGNGKYNGYDVLSVANNHSMDMGKKGLFQTMEFLKEKKIAWCGAAMNEHAVHDFPILERNGIKTAFIAATYSLNKLTTPKGKPWLVNHFPLNVPGCDLSFIKTQCATARKRGADFIVLSLHAGNAYQAYPSAHTVELFHRVFNECGADVILGGHPHNAQPMEVVTFTDPNTNESKKGFAIYSLADFVAYDIFIWCHMPVMLELTFSKGTKLGKTHKMISGVKILPLYMHYNPAKKSLRFIPLKKALAQKNIFDSEAQQELSDLEKFCFRYFLPEENDHLWAKT